MLGITVEPLPDHRRFGRNLRRIDASDRLRGGQRSGNDGRRFLKRRAAAQQQRQDDYSRYRPLALRIDFGVTQLASLTFSWRKLSA